MDSASRKTITSNYFEVVDFVATTRRWYDKGVTLRDAGECYARQSNLDDNVDSFTLLQYLIAYHERVAIYSWVRETSISNSVRYCDLAYMGT